MTIVAEVKDSTFITRLIVKDFESSAFVKHADGRSLYNNAIVNIFARLNTAGRALTEQEITLAWLKTGWREVNNEESKTKDCADELEELLTELNDNEENAGKQMSIDNLVNILSLFWIIVERSGDNRSELVLNKNDLVDGDIMKNIGKSTFKFWPIIKEVILDCNETFEHRSLNECFDRSTNAFYIICGWKFIAAISSQLNEGRVRDTEGFFYTQINTVFDMFIDKWFFSTQLSDTWSNQNNYPNYVSKLCKLHKIIVSCHDPHKSINSLSGELDAILSELQPSAVLKINNSRAYNRHEVSAYRNILWLWNRLTRDRWSEVQKPMKRKSAAPRLEVDHAIPVDIWEEKVENAYPISASRDSTGNEIFFNINGIRYTRSSLISEINVLGNCSLLLRSHNRSKGKEPFGVFLKDVYNNSEQIEKVKNALLLNDTFLSPLEVPIEQILIEINKRTEKIKSELIDYFNQKEKNRQDVG